MNADIGELAIAYLPAAFVWALLPSRFGKLADIFGSKPLMVIGMTMAAVTSLLVPQLFNLMGLDLLWAFQALCFAAGNPAEQALVADLTGGDQLGKAYGMYALVDGIGATLGPLIGGWLYQTAGEAIPFYLNGVVLLVSAMVLLFFLRVPNDILQQK